MRISDWSSDVCSSDLQAIFENLTIGAFAKAAGVNVETIRFYQRKGLLTEPGRPYGSIRRYGAVDVTRVRFVKSAQRLGFSLAEIAELLSLEDRKSGVSGTSVSVRVDIGGRRTFNTKKQQSK